MILAALSTAPAPDYGPFISGGAIVAAAVLTGFLARRTKQTREPIAIETLWARLDKLDRENEAIRREGGIFREGFEALWRWYQRFHDDWDGPTPITSFTQSEKRAIDRARATTDAPAPDDPTP